MDYSSKKLFFFESSHVFVGVLIKTKTIPEYLFISAWYIWIIIVSRHIYWDWFRCFKKNNSNNKHIETTSYHIFTHRIYHSSILISGKCIIFAQFDTNFEEIKTVRTLFQLLHDPLIIFFYLPDNIKLYHQFFKLYTYTETSKHIIWVNEIKQNDTENWKDHQQLLNYVKFILS